MLAFRNVARPRLYDRVELDTAVEQTLLLHLSHLGITCIIQAGAAEGFLIVFSFSWSQAPDSEMVPTNRGKTTEIQMPISWAGNQGEYGDEQKVLRSSI